MATSLNALTLRINADTSGVTAGAKIAKRDISLVNNSMRLAAGNAGKHQAATQALNNVMEAGAITQSEYARAQKAINDQLARSTGVTQRVNSLVAASMTPTQRLTQQVRELNAEYRRGNITQQELIRTTQHLRQSQMQAANSASTLVGRLKGFLAVYVGFHAIKSTFKLAMDLETSAIAFQTLTGSVAKGKAVISEIKDLANSTPLTLGGASKATKTMLGYGMSVQQTMPMLRQLGDISMGNEERLQSLALVMAQVSANGRLNGQDLLQMVNQGFNPLQQIAEKTGKSMNQLREDMSNGLITTQMVTEAIKSATSEGGLYYKSLENYSKSTEGRLEMLKTEAKSLGAELLVTLFPAIKATAGGLRDVFNAVKGFKDGMSEGTAKVVAGVAAFGTMVFVVPKVLGAIRAIVLAIRGWMAAHITLQAVVNPASIFVIGASLAAAAYAVGQVSAAYAEQDASIAAATAEAEANAEAVKAAAEAEKNSLAAIAARQAKQKESLAAYEKEWRVIRDQNVALREGPVYAAEMLRLRKEQDMLDKGYTRKQVEHIATLQKQNAALKQAKKEEEDRNKLIADREKSIKENIKSIGDSLNRSLMTPYDNLIQKLAEINVASKFAYISAEQAARARSEATEEFGKKTSPVKVELPPSIMRGSREEYKMLAERMSGSQQREESHRRQQLALQKAQIDIAERTNEILEGQEQIKGVS
tara:strand:+ start:1295 stop:3409 length:2115 start_codon:yes stop_codon:yes gene_type:complete